MRFKNEVILFNYFIYSFFIFLSEVRSSIVCNFTIYYHNITLHNKYETKDLLRIINV